MRNRILAVLAASCSTAALAGPQGWTISEASGSVQVSRGGLTTVAARGGAIAAGDTVTTGKGGRAVLVRGTEFMMVAPNSRLRLPAAAETSTGITRIVEEFGNVVFMIKKKMTPHFEVQTPYLAAVVKGTTFSVNVAERGTSLQVLEGAVEVSTVDGGARDLITPGAIALVSAGNRARMEVERGGVTKVITSPNAPAEATPAIVQAAVAVAPAEDAGATTLALAEPVYAAPALLQDTTGGLVQGSIGRGSTEVALAAVSSATRNATEASVTAVKIVDAAGEIMAARTDQAKTDAAADQSSADLAAAAQTKAAADRSAAEAAAAAVKSAEDAARARGEQEQAAAAKAASIAASDAAAKAASAAADAAAKAEADRAAKDAVEAQALRHHHGGRPASYPPARQRHSRTRGHQAGPGFTLPFAL